MCVSQIVLAQKDKVRGDSTRVEVIRFADEEEISNTEKKAIKRPLFLKTGVAAFLLGRQAIYVEKEMTDWLGLQVWVGASFGSPITRDLRDVAHLIPGDGYVKNWSENWDNNHDITDDYSDFTHRRNLPGILFGASTRIYLSDQGAEGYYLSVDLQFVQKRYSVARVQEGVNSRIYLEDDRQVETVNNMDFRASTGYQIHFGDNFAIDIFSSVGLWQAYKLFRHC